MPIRFPRQGNPLYPLPPDYPTLSEEGKRLARMNVLKLQETPEDLVTGWSFLRIFYLEPEESGWYKRWLPSPPMHYQMIRDMGQYSRNAWAAPRAFAKSTVIREAVLYLLLSRFNFAVSMIQATIKKYRDSLNLIRWQFENNPLLVDDFTKEFGEKLKPVRGVRPWSDESLRLPNGSWLKGGSTKTALRGERPDFLVIDDPEYDEDEGTDTNLLIEDFEKLLFKTLLPMLEKGCGLFWIGTLITRQSFLYTVTKGHDPRFRFFNRRVLAKLTEDGSSIWDEKWSLRDIADERQSLGEEAFQSEAMNNPGASSSRMFRIHPDFCTYRVEGAPEYQDNPLWADGMLYYRQRVRNGDEIEVRDLAEPFGPWVSNLYRMICVDFIRKPSATSDFACIGVFGFDSDDVLWVLDMYLDRVRGDVFIRKIYDLAYKWRVKIIGTESSSVQEEIHERAASLIAEWSAGTGYVPRVIPIRYAKRHLRNIDAPNQISKPERIAAMDWRFNQYKIRLPLHRKGEPAIAQLWYQIENFTMDLALLRYDDAVDTLGMHQYVVRRKGRQRGEPVRLPTVENLLREGRLADVQTGIPYLGGITPDVLTPQLTNELRRRKYGDRLRKPEDLVKWPTGPIQFLG